MNSQILKPGSAVAALAVGWMAAVLPLAIPVLFYDPADFVAMAVGYFFFTATLVVPCWLLLAIPLFIFLSPSSDFWRSQVAIPFGAVVGTMLSTSFFLAIANYPSESPGQVLAFALSGAASGGTMLGMLARRNRIGLTQGVAFTQTPSGAP